MAGKALVTGRSGFTGRHIRAEIEALGYEVLGLGRGLAGDDPHVAVDLRVGESLQDIVVAIQPEVVVHLAAVAFVANASARLLAMGEPEETYNVCSGVTYSIQDVLLILADTLEWIYCAQTSA